MDILTRKKIWISMIALSLILSGTVVGSGNSAYAKSLSSRTASAPQPNEPKRKHFPIIEEAAPILGLSVDKLTASLKEGKSLLDIAKLQGISEADFTGKMLALRVQKIDEAVTRGKISTERAEQIKHKMQAHITYLLQSKHLLELQSKSHQQNDARRIISPEKLASLIGISEEKLVEQLKSGKSITEIANAQGISKQQLLAKIKEQLTPYLEKAMDHKGHQFP